MKIEVLGSGSSGNCYLLKSSKGECLILEAGIKAFDVLKKVEYKNILGVIVSHRHGDHAGKVNEFLKSNIDVYMSFDTLDSLKIDKKEMQPKVFNEKTFSLGGFDIRPFRLNHDVTCHGFLIRHKEMKGNLLFCTDTATIPYTFDDVQTLMIEADYDLNMLSENKKNGKVNSYLAKRIIRTHFSIDKAIKFCKERDLSKLRKIILIHLSKHNADKDNFKRRMIENTGKCVYVAEKGVEINIDDNPFL